MFSLKNYWFKFISCNKGRKRLLSFYNQGHIKNAWLFIAKSLTFEYKRNEPKCFNIRRGNAVWTDRCLWLMLKIKYNFVAMGTCNEWSCLLGKTFLIVNLDVFILKFPQAYNFIRKFRLIFSMFWHTTENEMMWFEMLIGMCQWVEVNGRTDPHCSLSSVHFIWTRGKFGNTAKPWFSQLILKKESNCFRSNYNMQNKFHKNLN